jgi:hypothetical protein
MAGDAVWPVPDVTAVWRTEAYLIDVGASPMARTKVYSLFLIAVAMITLAHVAGQIG